MENILDFEYVLRELDQDRSESWLAECADARRNFQSARDTLFQQQEDLQTFREYGAPFEGAPAPDPPDWNQFISDSQSHLANKSKDLWICVFLTEVLIAQWGHRGLAEGFQLVREVIERHWDQLEPSPTAEEGAEYTLKLLSAISRKEDFFDAIRFSPITSESGEFSPASCATIDSIDDGERGALIGDTSDEFISETHAALKKSIEEWGLIDDVLESKCPDGKPPSAKLRDALNDCLNQVEGYYPQLIVESEPGDETAGPLITSLDQNETSSGALSGDSHLKNRELAFKQLESLSRYFAENEPNSPISSLLRQAARYGRLSFAELMEELADDGDAREQILRLAGVGKDGDGGSGYEESDDD